MTRTEFSAKVRKAAWARCEGRCEGCTAKLFPGKFAYDHDRADGLGGEPTLDNCKVLCAACHSEKTHKHDRPIMQKADNIRAKHLSLKPKRPWSAFRKKMNGSVERRET
jgi:5-methylcytosine-specific restriction endonuclease McrA